MKVRKYTVDGVRHVEITDYDPELRWMTLRTSGNIMSDEQHLAYLIAYAEKERVRREATRRHMAIAKDAPWEDVP